MNFPSEDVVKNVRYFLELVKRSTSTADDASTNKNAAKGNTILV